jgi:hypothetical protein
MASFFKQNPVPVTQPGNFFGKQVDFFEIDLAANIANVQLYQAPNGPLDLVIQVVEENATIEMIGTVGTLNLVGANGNLSSANGAFRVLVSGTGAWANAAALQTAIRNLGTVTVGNSTVGFSNISVGAANVYLATF